MVYRRSTSCEVADPDCTSYGESNGISQGMGKKLPATFFAAPSYCTINDKFTACWSAPHVAVTTTE